MNKTTFDVSVQEYNEKDIEMIREIGEGTTSRVHLGIHHGLKIAMKILKDEDEIEDRSTRYHLQSDFVNELTINMSLRHPNIILLLGCSQIRKSLIFEYCDGDTLNCRDYGLGKLKQCVSICLCIGRALFHAHALGIMHRDIKPSQIMVCRQHDGEMIPKLGDWGLATFCKNKEPSLSGVTGTLEFMAPEVLRHDIYGTPADVYSFGILLYCMITGENYPYFDRYLTPAQAALAVAKKNLRPRLNPRIPETIKKIITMCWATDISIRPTMDVIINMLNTVLRQLIQTEKELQHGSSNDDTSSQVGLFGWVWGGNQL